MIHQHFKTGRSGHLTEKVLFRPTISGCYIERELQNCILHQWNGFGQCDFSSVFMDGEVALFVTKGNGVFDLSICTCIWIVSLHL